MTLWRRRWTACLVLAVLVLELLAVPAAWADSRAETDFDEMTFTAFDLADFTQRAETLQAISA